MADVISVKKQMEVLLAHAKGKGIPVDYRSIAKATEMSTNNVHKIIGGETRNPGVGTMRKLAAYFGVGLAYFDCVSEAECQDFLQGVEKQTSLDSITLRASKIGPRGMQAIDTMLDFVEEMEGRGDES